ncbi:hypothetical protein [Agrobacterium sp. NPDC089420]|uniref:hypothetical protein n=1 Tax=Agrobacterium sp. NPDC089420 TaxID=3363918 RepID=UPI00384AB7E1
MDTRIRIINAIIFSIFAFLATDAIASEIAWQAGQPAMTAVPQSFAVTVAEIPAIRLDQPSKPLWREILTGSVGSGLASAFAAIFGVWFALRNTTSTLRQKSNEVEIKELQTRLNEFYGPFNQISRENELLSLEFRNRHKAVDDKFRTLIALTDPAWRASLDGSDKAIIEKMITNAAALRDLIREKSGLVDLQLIPILAKASAHYCLLELASEGLLDRKSDRFKDNVYPRELDDAISKEIARLNSRIIVLLAKPGKKHRPIESLKL